MSKTMIYAKGVQTFIQKNDELYQVEFISVISSNLDFSLKQCTYKGTWKAGMHQTRGNFYYPHFNCGEVKTLDLVAECLEGNIQPPEKWILILYKSTMYKNSDTR